jgi:flagellar motor switch protein FliG
MGTGINIVITVYGHDKIIDKIAASSFYSSAHFYDRNDSNAEIYCKTINRLELNGNFWIFARNVSENTQYPLESFLPLKFDIILKLDNRVIQTMLKHINSYDVARALKGEKENVQERIFSNMSERAAKMLKENLEVMGPVLINDVIESQEKIINTIRHLEETGEIIICSKGETIE